MSDVRDTLRSLAESDRRGAVWCAGLCALTVRHLMPAEALPALRLALLWAQGVGVRPGRLRRAGVEAQFSNAADAASAACYAAVHPKYTAGAVVDAARHAALAAAAGDTGRHWYQARLAYLAHLSKLVHHQLTPLPHPGASPLGDWLLERLGEGPGRIGTLGESLAWARRHRLRWWMPAERWSAEHRIYPELFMENR